MLRKVVGPALALAAGILLLALCRNLWNHPEQLAAQLFMGLPLLVVGVLDLRMALRLRKWKDASTTPRILPACLMAVSAAMVSYESTVLYVDHRLEERTHEGVFNDCYKVWAARGLVLATSQIVRDGTQNTIESVTLAFDEGATGCEIDVFFDAPMGQFIVSHDRPYHLKNGKLLTLAEMLQAVGQRGYIWLDFKKLRHLDGDALAVAVAELSQLCDQFGDRKRMYVEGEDPLNLSAFRDAGFPTIFDTHPLPDSNYVTPALINLYKILYYFGDFTVMGMNYGTVGDPIYGERTQDALGEIPLFIYHVEPQPDVLQSLAESSSVRVILVENQSLNRYGLNGCP
jgi:glycerophosphoryl diester phosphodiesterase